MRQRQAQNEIQALVTVLFPEFTQVFVDPCGQTALTVLKTFRKPLRLWPRQGLSPSSNCCAREIPAHYGRPTAQKLVALAKASVSSGRAIAGRSLSLRIDADQLEHTQANLARLEVEIEELLTNDPGVRGLQQVPGCGPQDSGSPAR